MPNIFDYINSPDDNKRFAELYLKSSKFRQTAQNDLRTNSILQGKNALVSLDVDSNGAKFVVRKGEAVETATSITELRLILDHPLTSRVTYSGRQATSGRMQPSLGGYHNSPLETLAAEMGGDIVKETYATDTVNNSYRAILGMIGQEGKSGVALPVVDDSLIHSLTFVPYGSNEPVPLDVFIAKMKEHFKLGFDPGNANLFKRLKALTGDRLASFASAETNLNVGFLSPEAVMDLRHGGAQSFISQFDSTYHLYGKNSAAEAATEVINKSMDGQMYMSADRLRKFENELKQRRNSLERLRDSAGDGPYKRQLQREINALNEGLGKLRDVRLNGGSFNARFLGSELYKGDVNIIEAEDYKYLAGRAGWDGSGDLPDILTLEGQGKPELSFGKGSIETLEMRQKAKALEIGITEAASFPGVISGEFIERNFIDQANEIKTDFTSNKMMGGLRRMIDDALKTPEELGIIDSGEIEDYLQMQRYARSLEAAMDYGISPAMVDSQAAKFISMYKKHFLKYREGKSGRVGSFTRLPDMAFRTRVKAGSMAEISSTTSLFSARKKMTPMELMDGVIRYDKRIGRFGFTPTDFTQMYKAGGGPDSDDTYRVMHFYDTEAKKMMAYSTRQPFEMGEYMWMESDMSTMPMDGIDKDLQIRIRKLEADRAEILNNLATNGDTHIRYINSVQDRGREARKNMRSWRDQLNNINRELHEIYSANFENISLSEKFSETREFMAPKGFEVTGQTRARYLDKNIFRSYASVGDTTEDFIENYSRSKGQSGSIFDFRGNDFNLVDERYYHLTSDAEILDIAKNAPESNEVKEIKRIMALLEDQSMSQNGRLLTEAEKRLALHNYARNFLGNWVNTKTTIDNLIETQLRDVTTQTAWSKIRVLEREKIIDAAVKTGDYNVLEAAKVLTDEALRTSVRFLIEEAKVNPDAAIKLSGFLVDTRLMGSADLIQSMAEEAGLSLDDIVSKTDPMTSAIIKRMQQVEELEKSLMEISDASSIGAVGNLDGFVGSADEFDIARRFLDDYVLNYQELINDSSTANLLERMMAGEETVDGFFGEEELNRRSLGFLAEEGLLDRGNEAKLERQLLATAQYLTENRKIYEGKVGRGLFDPLTTVGVDDSLGLSMDRLTFSAVFKNKNKKLIAEYNRLINFRDNALSYDMPMTKLERRLDKTEARIAEIERILPEGTMPSSIGEMVASSPGVNNGKFTRIIREKAEQIAESQVVSNVKIKPFTLDGLRTVVNETKGAKGALIVLGMVAALGALHGERRNLDRTPEQMGGPPLLPGGSAYEDYSDIEDYSSMYSVAPGGSMNPGMLYKVNVNGSMNPTELQSRISSITGGSMTSTIYQGRQTVRTGRQNSESILGERLGY